MEVKQISLDDVEYFNIANRHGSVFNSDAWLKIFDNDVCLFGIYDNNVLKGSFYFLKIKLKWGGIIYVNPYFTPDCGFFIVNNFQVRTKINTFNKDVLASVASFLSKFGHSFILSMPDSIIDMQPFIWNSLKVSVAYTYIIDLRSDINEIYNNFGNNLRFSLSKAGKAGIEVRNISDYKIVEPLILNTFSRSKKQINLKILNKILFEFANENNSFVLAAYFNGKLSAGIFVVYTKHRAYCLFSGYDDLNFHRAAGKAVHFEAIKYAKNLGIEQMDLEGSMIPNIEMFYRGFGGVLTPKFIVSKTGKVFETIEKLKKFW